LTVYVRTPHSALSRINRYCRSGAHGATSRLPLRMRDVAPIPAVQLVAGLAQRRLAAHDECRTRHASTRTTQCSAYTRHCSMSVAFQSWASAFRHGSRAAALYASSSTFGVSRNRTPIASLMKRLIPFCRTLALHELVEVVIDRDVQPDRHSRGDPVGFRLGQSKARTAAFNAGRSVPRLARPTRDPHRSNRA